jgi:hypothetical protein
MIVIIHITLEKKRAQKNEGMKSRQETGAGSVSPCRYSRFLVPALIVDD